MTMTRSHPSGYPFRRLPTMQPIPAPDGQFAHQGVAYGPTADRFWLRPTPTFDRVGPLFPAGTRVTLVGADNRTGRRGRFRLYMVGVEAYVPDRPNVVDRMSGWAVFDDADIASIMGYNNNVALLRSYGKTLDGKFDPTRG